MNKEKPYSQEDYEKAKLLGLDLDKFSDYMDYYALGEREKQIG